MAVQGELADDLVEIGFLLDGAQDRPAQSEKANMMPGEAVHIVRALEHLLARAVAMLGELEGGIVVMISLLELAKAKTAQVKK